MYTPVHTHDTHIHTYTHIHSHRLGLYHLVRLWALISHTVFTKHVNMCKNKLAHCYVNTIFVTNTHTTHTHMCTHTCTCTHTDWACNACSDFGFLFLTLLLQSVHVHECTHLCTHTCTYTQRLGLYHLQSFYKAYMCMNEHTYTHMHTHTVPRSEFVLLFLTLSLFSQSTYICMNVHT